jgi:hypothetical protein
VLHLLNLEQIEALLLEVPVLVSQLENHDPDFVPALKAWLAKVEDALTNNRMPAASAVAVCRAELIAVERGEVDDPLSKGRMNSRKHREARATHLLRRAADIVNETIRSRRSQIDEASRWMMQLVAAADLMGLIPPDTGTNRTAYLQGILQVVSARTELTSLVVHVMGLLGQADCLIVLDRSIADVRQH